MMKASSSELDVPLSDDFFLPPSSPLPSHRPRSSLTPSPEHPRPLTSSPISHSPDLHCSASSNDLDEPLSDYALLPPSRPLPSHRPCSFVTPEPHGDVALPPPKISSFRSGLEVVAADLDALFHEVHAKFPERASEVQVVAEFSQPPLPTRIRSCSLCSVPVSPSRALSHARSHSHRPLLFCSHCPYSRKSGRADLLEHIREVHSLPSWHAHTAVRPFPPVDQAYQLHLLLACFPTRPGESPLSLDSCPESPPKPPPSKAAARRRHRKPPGPKVDPSSLLESALQKAAGKRTELFPVNFQDPVLSQPIQSSLAECRFCLLRVPDAFDARRAHLLARHIPGSVFACSHCSIVAQPPEDIIYHLSTAHQGQASARAVLPVGFLGQLMRRAFPQFRAPPPLQPAEDTRDQTPEKEPASSSKPPPKAARLSPPSRSSCSDCGVDVARAERLAHAAKHLGQPLYSCLLCPGGWDASSPADAATHLAFCHSLFPDQLHRSPALRCAHPQAAALLPSLFID